MNVVSASGTTGVEVDSAGHHSRRVTPAHPTLPVITSRGSAAAINTQSAHSSVNQQDSISRRCEFQVELQKGEEGLGFSIYCRSRDDVYDAQTEIPDDDRPINVFVRRLAPNGLAETDGRIRPDDQLLEVNGQRLVEVSYSEAADLLRNAQGLVRLRMARDRGETHSSSSSDSSPDSKKKHGSTGTGGPPQSQTSMNPVIGPGPLRRDDEEQPTPAAKLDAGNDKSAAKDINSNDNQCKNLQTSALRLRLVEAQKRRSQLTDQLNHVNKQITVCSSGRAASDDAMTDRLVEAETATKKAQKDMIALQASYTASKSQYTELETQLRHRVNDLQEKYRETQDIMKHCQSKDDAYSAERETIRQRHQTKENELTLQMKSLNEKIRQLETDGDSTGPGRDEPLVRLLTHTAISADGSRQQQQLSSRPKIVTNAPSTLRSSSDSDDDEEEPETARSATDVPRRLESTGQPVTVLSKFLRTADNDSLGDRWSISSRGLPDDPPSYPPPPPPPGEGYDSIGSSSSSDTDEEAPYDDVVLRRPTAASEEQKQRTGTGTSEGETRQKVVVAVNVGRVVEDGKRERGDTGRAGNVEGFRDVDAGGPRGQQHQQQHRRTDSDDKNASISSGEQDRKQRKNGSSSGMGRFRRIFGKQHKSDASLTPSNSDARINEHPAVGGKVESPLENDGKKSDHGHRKFWKHRHAENDKNEERSSDAETTAARHKSKSKSKHNDETGGKAGKAKASPSAGNDPAMMTITTTTTSTTSVVEDGKEKGKKPKLKLKFHRTKSSSDKSAAASGSLQIESNTAGQVQLIGSSPTNQK